MKTSLFLSYITLLAAAVHTSLPAQQDSTGRVVLQEEIYNRPFVVSSGPSLSVGGYVEGNTNYFATDGVSEGFSMELRRFNVFFYSSISRSITFISELEFEHGTEEIALETAQLDFEVDPALVFRGGILLVPIGGYNQNHDSPKWDFIERPLVSTEIIPSTLSQVGFGLYGKIPVGAAVLTYDGYIMNGLDDGIILNDLGRTYLQAGKSSEAFEEDNNGEPAYAGKLALSHSDFGEIGFSYFGGAYNRFKVEGERVDESRWLSIYAVDIGATIGKAELHGEIAMNMITVPDDLAEMFGTRQWGAYAEVVHPILNIALPGSKEGVLSAGLRLEHVDYNTGAFESTGENIGDHVSAVALGLSFRPNPGTVVRANFRRHWITDILGNAPVHHGGVQVGIASYF